MRHSPNGPIHTHVRVWAILIIFQNCVRQRRLVSKMAAMTKNRNFFKWPKERVQNDNQRSTTHIHKTKTGVELRCSGRVDSSCSTSRVCRIVGSIRHSGHRTKTNKTKTQHRKLKRWATWTIKRGRIQVPTKDMQFLFLTRFIPYQITSI